MKIIGNFLDIHICFNLTEDKLNSVQPNHSDND